MRPYGVMSDLHCHAWSSFGAVGADGVNTRLAQILHEIDRCAGSVLELGGKTVVIAGDIFHVRGNVMPSVFNPVRETFRSWLKRGISFEGIPGNHDLESKTSAALGSSCKMLEDDEGIFFTHDHDGGPFAHQGRCYVPWMSKHSDLLEAIGDLAAALVTRGHSLSGLDLFIHAGIDGVLDGMPDHGLTAAKLADFGFKRVFAGDYHHHKDMGRGVYSIGAPTMHTWGDVGTKAGWLIVHPDRVQWVATHAPQFIEITGDEGDDLPLIVDGHYVKARIGKATNVEVSAWREKLTAMGAKGVLVQSVPVAAATPRGERISALGGLPTAVSDYAKAQGYPERVSQICHEILSEVQSA